MKKNKTKISIKETKVEKEEKNLPPLPVKKVLFKQVSNVYNYTPYQENTTTNDLLAVKRSSVIRQGSQLPIPVIHLKQL